MLRIFPCLFVLSLAACQGPWQQYDVSLYNTIANPSPEAMAAHIETLERMVQTDPPPPGLCAELGYFLAISGRSGEAAHWFERELVAYPQSEQFLEQLSETIGPANNNIQP